MNSTMRIQVRVTATKAHKDLALIQKQLRGIAMEASKVAVASKAIDSVGRSAGRTSRSLGRMTKATTTTTRAMGRQAAQAQVTGGALHRMSMVINGASAASSKGLIGMSKNLQWVGRQLNFNFTIPIGVAAVAATSWALDVERAFTRVRKVYGDGKLTPSQEDDLDKMPRALRLLSDLFGVAQDQVVSLAASFAAAGAEGGALVRSVQTGLELQILGDYENLEDVFAGLLTIQKAFRLDAEETAAAVALLNTVENKTAADLPGLVEGIEKAGSMAAASGVDFRQLAAAIAGMTPVAGGPEEIGTSLKTMMSRIVEPTSKIEEAFAGIGVNIEELLSSGMNSLDVIYEMAQATADLSDAERARLGSILGGRRQANRVLALWDSMTDAAGDYKLVMDALDPANDAANIARAQQEINTLLQSDPRKFEIVTNAIKNFMIDAVIPLIPAILAALDAVRRLFQWFSELDPAIQRYIGLGIAAVAVTGILAQLIGSLGLLFGTLANFILKPLMALGGLIKGFWALFAFIGKGILALFAGPWGWALAAGLVALYLFRDDAATIFKTLWDYIQRGFAALPQGIANVARAIVDILYQAAQAIASFFSGIFGGGFGFGGGKGAAPQISKPANPRQAGVYHEGGIVPGKGEQPALLMGGEMVLTAQQQAELFKVASQGIRTNAQTAQRSADVKQVANAGGADAGVQLGLLFRELDNLEGALNGVGSQMEAQQAIVDGLDEAYEQAQQAVEDFERSMEPLEAEIDALNETLSAAETELSRLGSVPIRGMGAMEDAIFDNEMATKRLRLELLKMEDAGKSFQDIQREISAINGDIEMLRGKMNTLQAAGAGSEILNVYRDQIGELEKQKDGLKESAEQASELEDQLADLERAGQILALQQDITFDPLVRQIDEMVNGVAEMDFDDIVASITEQQGIIEDTNATLALRQAEYDEQLAQLDLLKAREREIGDARDAERKKLENIKAVYDEIADTIREIEGLIADTLAASSDLLSGGAGGGGGGGGAGIGGGGAIGDFDDVGFGELPEFGELALDEMIDQLEKDLEKMWEDFDLLAPFRKKWEQFTTWAQGAWERFKGWLNGLEGSMPSLSFGGLLDSIPGLDTLKSILGEVWSRLKRLGEIVVTMAQKFWSMMNPALHEFKELWGSIKTNLDEIGTLFMTALGALVLFGEAMWWIATNPFTEWLAGVVATLAGAAVATLISMITSAVTFLVEALGFLGNILQGDWGAAWENLKTMFTEMVDIMVAPFEGVYDAFSSIGSSVVTGLIDGVSSFIGQFWEWVTNFPTEFINRIKSALGIASPSTVFMQIGVDILLGLLQGLQNTVGQVLGFITALPGQIVGALATAATLLIGRGRQFLTGLRTGMVQRFVDVISWVTQIPSRIGGAIVGAFTRLNAHGMNFIAGLWNGMISKFNEVRTWVGNIGSRVSGAIGSLGSKLWNAGWDLMMGFKRGIERGWDNVKGFLSGLNPANYKGPPERDRKMLVENGRLMMQGLQEGLAMGWADVTRELERMEPVVVGRSNFGGARGQQMYAPSGGGNTNNFYGDLSFPNITDPNDADEFISNLEALAGSDR